jgi:Zn-dependent protease
MINIASKFLQFFKRKLVLGRFSGIPVSIDYRWFIVLLLLSVLVAANIPIEFVGNEFVQFMIGMTTVLIFFVTLFLHEYAHAYAARREGIGVLEILLHPFGGIAHLRREPDSPGAEFRIAIAGPAASLAIAFLFLALFAASRSLGTRLLTPLLFLLFLLNLILAVSNLFPGFPLDGGRVLRAILWKRGMNLSEATKLTGKFGQIIAAALVFFGVAIIGFSRDLFTGLWSIIVGVFLFDSATSFIKGVRNFENLVVENVMEMPVPVSPEMSFMECVDKIIPYHRHTVFPAAQDRQLYGFVVLEDIKESLPREKWRETLIREVMRPIREDYFVDANLSVPEARELLRTNGLGALGVVDNEGKLVGFLRRGRIRRRN